MLEKNDIELVVTTPATQHIEANDKLSFRTTQGCILQLIATAESRLLLLSPFLQSLEDTETSLPVQALAEAVKSKVRLTVITSPHGVNIIKQAGARF